MGASLSHARGAEVLEKFNDGMRRIARNGELERIRRRWHPADN
ncbi:hypothetical protein [Pseudoduganella sp. OTU4001]